jgi:hypothetical protein
LISDWDESAVTWVKRTTPNGWLSFGGDFLAAVASRLFSTFTSGAWVSFDLPPALVQGWIDNPATNCGVIVKTSLDYGPDYLTADYDTAVFASSEDPSISLRPKLELTCTASGNVTPFVHLTSPTPGLVVSAGQDITLAASAGDADGSVSRVEFFDNGQCLGTDLSFPYGLLFAIPDPGSHTLTAVVYDNTSSSATSTPVTVQVRWPIYAADMSSNPDWILAGSWAYGPPTGADGSFGYPDPASGFTGPNVIGYDLSGPYGYLLSADYAVTPAIDCSNYTNVQLEFQSWLGVEGSSWDHATVEVSRNGISWTTLWSNPSSPLAGGCWVKRTFDMSAVADGQSSVRVRWGMGPCDSSYFYGGWNLDDVLASGLRSTPMPDSNGNGMADAWETYYFGGTNTFFGGPLEDKDHDGCLNRDEFIAGTDPTNDNSRFELAAGISNGLLWVSCPTVNPGPFLWGYRRIYGLESCTNLSGAGWSGITACTNIPSSAGQVICTNNMSAPGFFCRGRVRLE